RLCGQAPWAPPAVRLPTRRARRPPAAGPEPRRGARAPRRPVAAVAAEVGRPSPGRRRPRRGAGRGRSPARPHQRRGTPRGAVHRSVQPGHGHAHRAGPDRAGVVVGACGPLTRVADAASVARAVFGYDALRPGQQEVIDAVVGGRDALAIMATGAGKSAIYAIAGRLIGRPTVVVSPLLALQRDQAVALEGPGVSVVVINAAQSVRAHHDALRSGAYYMFLAPEQLADASVLDAVRAARPGLVAVEEAHLVAQWGADFRPDYLRLAAAIDALGRPPVLGLTATATSVVRQEIIDGLGM